jgi:1-acyl-sn-glycerol-3-phosphate acyltransferase
MNPLRRRLDIGWRLFGTGFSFFCFGIGAIVISMTVFPLISLLSPRRELRRRRIQRAMRQVMRLFVWLMKTLGVISCEVHGAEKLRRPGQLVIANHPSLIDVVILITLMPEVDCIVKQALWRNPFLRWPVVWAGYIPNRDPENLVDECAAALRAGRSLIVFPEGTRTIPGEAMQFKRGAAQIALAAGCEVRPVRITVAPLMLGKHQPWYWVPPQPGHWKIVAGDIIAPSEIAAPGGAQGLAARQLTRRFMDRLSTHPGSPSPV